MLNNHSNVFLRMDLYTILNLFASISITCGYYGQTVDQVVIQTAEGLVIGSKEHFEMLSSIHISKEKNSPEKEETARKHIVFDPTILDFREQSVGIPTRKQITVINQHQKQSVTLLRLMGRTSYFQCSFFKNNRTVLKPGENATIDVVFLPRHAGKAETTVYVETTRGTYEFHVFGSSYESEFRFESFSDVLLPLNASFAPFLELHNPLPTTFTLEEIYSSGADLHIEPVDGSEVINLTNWEIEPYSSRVVARARYIAWEARNRTLYLCIKGRDAEHNVHRIIAAFQVNVLEKPGLYVKEVYNFGLIRTSDAPKYLRLAVVNSAQKSLLINSITSVGGEGVRIQYRPTYVPPEINHSVDVGIIGFDPSHCTESGMVYGSLEISAKNSSISSLRVPFKAKVIKGALAIAQNVTLFYAGKMNITREIFLKNAFDEAVVIYNISIGNGGSTFFKVLNFRRPVLIGRGESKRICMLKFVPRPDKEIDQFPLVLLSNTSAFEIPLKTYTAKLRMKTTLPEVQRGQLDIGTLGVRDQRSVTFTLHNDNPVEIALTSFHVVMRLGSLELLGVFSEAEPVVKDPNAEPTVIATEKGISFKQFVIPAGHVALMQLTIIAPEEEAQYAGEVYLNTPYEAIVLPVTYTVSAGSLKPLSEQLVLSNCFPGIVCNADLIVSSTFESFMEVISLKFLPDDVRFSSETAVTDLPSVIFPEKDTKIVRVFFDAGKQCSTNCYSGLSPLDLTYQQWLMGLSLSKEVADIDQYLYMVHQKRWESLKSEGQDKINLTIQLDTDLVKGFLFPTQAVLKWPYLMGGKEFGFPLTQVNNVSVQSIQVHNPSDLPVLVQLLLLCHYPNQQTIIDLLQYDWGSDLDNEDNNIFFLADALASNYTDPEDLFGSSVDSDLAESLGVSASRHSVVMMIAPHSSRAARIAFRPPDELSHTSVLIVRNNLTVLEAMPIKGKGGSGEFRFGSKKSPSQMALLFEMEKFHFKECANLSVQLLKSFTARNTGQLPMYVHGFSIDGEPCQSGGFKVRTCEPFLLAANSSKKLYISFTPDYSMARVMRTLEIHTTLNQTIRYPLKALIPTAEVERCRGLAPRPNIEFTVFLMCVSLCLIAMLIVPFIGFLEAKDVLRQQYQYAWDSWNCYSVEDLVEFNSTANLAGQILDEDEQRYREEFKREKQMVRERIRAGFASSQQNGSAAHSTEPERVTGPLQRQRNHVERVSITEVLNLLKDGCHQLLHVAVSLVKSPFYIIRYCVTSASKFVRRAREKETKKKPVKQVAPLVAEPVENQRSRQHKQKKLNRSEVAVEQKRSHTTAAKPKTHRPMSVEKSHSLPPTKPLANVKDAQLDSDEVVPSGRFSVLSSCSSADFKKQREREMKAKSKAEKAAERKREELEERDESSSTTTESTDDVGLMKNFDSFVGVHRKRSKAKSNVKFDAEAYNSSQSRMDSCKPSEPSSSNEVQAEIDLPYEIDKVSQSRRSATTTQTNERPRMPNMMKNDLPPHLVQRLQHAPNPVPIGVSPNANTHMFKLRRQVGEVAPWTREFDSDTGSSSENSDSPPPQWDNPGPTSADGDLSELAEGTRQFIQRRDMWGSDQFLAPPEFRDPPFIDPLLTNARPLKHDDGVGQDPMMNGHGLMLSDVEFTDRIRSSATIPPSMMNGGVRGRAEGNNAAVPAAGGGSFMQQLQAERKQRWREYQRRSKLAEEQWPGMQNPAINNEPLWEPTTVTSSTWGSVSKEPTVEPRLSTSTQPSDPTWGSSVWGPLRPPNMGWSNAPSLASTTSTQDSLSALWSSPSTQLNQLSALETDWNSPLIGSTHPRLDPLLREDKQH